MSARQIIPLPPRAVSVQSQQRASDQDILAPQIYRGVWDEFYRWKSENDRQSLQVLCVPSPDVHRGRHCDPHNPDDYDWVSDHSYPSSYASSVADPNDTELDEELSFLTFQDSPSSCPRFIVTTYACLPDELLDNGDEESIFTVGCFALSIRPAFAGAIETSGVDPTFRPHPLYSSCAPTSQNVTHNSHGELLAFSPFEDDPAFDLIHYLSPFAGFQWQADFIDPDIEMIQVEGARRLIYQLGFSLVEVDALRFFTPLRKSRASGLLWDTSQRDLLLWPGMQLSELPELHVSDVGVAPASRDPYESLKAGLKGFCPNLNCIQTSCGVHNHTNYPELQPVKPLFTSQNLQLKKGNPCSDHCFRHIDLSGDSQLETIHWKNEDDIKTLEVILQISPDILPCDLAIIVHANCQDVFIHRTRFLPDNTIDDISNFDHRQSELQLYKDEPLSQDNLVGKAEFSPLSPCQHKGLCNRDSGCECSLNKHHCQRNCSCGPQCAIQWKGCQCAAESGRRKKLCSSSECPCWASARECDPELCRKCDARGKKSQKLICNNVDSQRACYPLIEIKRGSWGLGAFATQRLQAKQVIGEYTGEILLLNDDIEAKTTLIADYTGLNYKFDLNKTTLIDSMHIGNEMRYLNHEGPKTEEKSNDPPVRPKANCSGKVIYVNNVHKILFYTEHQIEAGSELFIDYGLAYWLKREDDTKRNVIYWR